MDETIPKCVSSNESSVDEQKACIVSNIDGGKGWIEHFKSFYGSSVTQAQSMTYNLLLTWTKYYNKVNDEINMTEVPEDVKECASQTHWTTTSMAPHWTTTSMPMAPQTTVTPNKMYLI